MTRPNLSPYHHGIPYVSGEAERDLLYSNRVNQRVYRIDIDEFQRWTGSAWVPIGSGAEVDVRSQAARGDDSSDDTAAFQASITAAIASGSSVVRVRGDRTYIVGELTTKSGITFVGDGPETVIKARAAAVDGNIVRNERIDIAGYAGDSNIGFYNLTIDGNKANMTGGARKNGIGLAHVTGVYIDQVWFRNCGYHGLDLVGCFDVNIGTVYFEDMDSGALQIDSAETGSLVAELTPSLNADSSVCRRVRIGKVYAKDCAGPAIHLHKEGADSVVIDEVIVENCQGAVVDDGQLYTNAATKVTIGSVVSRDTPSGSHDIALTGGLQALEIGKVVIYNSGGYGIIVGTTGRTSDLVSIDSVTVNGSARSAVRIANARRVVVGNVTAAGLTGTDYASVHVSDSLDVAIGTVTANPNTSVSDGVLITSLSGAMKRVAIGQVTVTTARDGLAILSTGAQALESLTVGQVHVLGCSRYQVRIEGASTSNRVAYGEIDGINVDANSAGDHAVRFRFCQKLVVGEVLVRGVAAGMGGVSISDCPDTTVGTGYIESTAGGLDAIAFTSASGGICTGVRATGFTNGLNVYSGADYVTAGDCDFRGCTNPVVNNGANSKFSNIHGSGLGEMGADRGDASVTLVSLVDAEAQQFSTALTANRTITLSTSNVYRGARFRIVRTGLGAFTLNVGGLKTIPSATAAFVDVMHDGTAWRLAGYGTL